MFEHDKADLGALPALCRFSLQGQAPRLGWIEDGTLRDLTATGDASLVSLASLLATTAASSDLSAHVRALLPRAEPVQWPACRLLAPLDRQEVWAAGVTYERSREARMSESEHAADMYWRVYEAARPEIFFKADMRRTRGAGEPISVRSDSRWTVPEPELVLLLTPQLQIAAFTIGNDVSARDIEGENPLYLPQAKVFDGGCALGPALVPAAAVPDPYALAITCSIEREHREVWRDATTTAKLHRTFAELAACLGFADTFPHGVFLMTGTCLVPPDTLTLRRGDEVCITIEGLGTLRNPVR